MASELVAKEDEASRLVEQSKVSAQEDDLSSRDKFRSSPAKKAGSWFFNDSKRSANRTTLVYAIER